MFCLFVCLPLWPTTRSPELPTQVWSAAELKKMEVAEGLALRYIEHCIQKRAVQAKDGSQAPQPTGKKFASLGRSTLVFSLVHGRCFACVCTELKEIRSCARSPSSTAEAQAWAALGMFSEG